MGRSLSTNRLLEKSGPVETTTYAPTIYYSITRRISGRVKVSHSKPAAYREGDITALTSDLSVYLRKQGDGRFYYARFNVPRHLRQLAQNRRLIVWSLRTDQYDQAALRAIELRLKTLTLLEAGHAVGNKSLREAVDAYLKFYGDNCELGKGGYSPRTLAQFKPPLNRLVQFMPKRATLTDLTTEALDAFELDRRNPKPFTKKLEEAIETARQHLRERHHKHVYRDSNKSKRDHLLASHPNFKLLSEYFGTAKITFSLLQAAVQFNRAPAFKTLYLEFYAIKKFLLWCAKKGWYTGTALGHELKKSPQDRLKRDRRSEFKESDYKKLIGYTTRNEFLDPEARNPSTQYSNRMLRCLILFLSNTGCRPGEIRDLKWSDIRTSRAEDGQQVIEFTVKATNTKVRKHRIVVGREGALTALNIWRGFRSQTNRYPTDSDYIFANYYTGKSMRDLGKQFVRLLDKVGISKDEYGNPYTLYSLRHFYISWRLREGVSIALVANNAGTSPMMIHKHYSHITSSEVKSALVKTASRPSSKATPV